jgi:hypothetical protein
MQRGDGRGRSRRSESIDAKRLLAQVPATGQPSDQRAARAAGIANRSRMVDRRLAFDDRSTPARQPRPGSSACPDGGQSGRALARIGRLPARARCHARPLGSARRLWGSGVCHRGRQPQSGAGRRRTQPSGLGVLLAESWNLSVCRAAAGTWICSRECSLESRELHRLPLCRHAHGACASSSARCPCHRRPR